MIRGQIISKIQNGSKFYGLMFDETTDIAKEEQMSLILRYFDMDKNQIKEQFIGFFDCYDIAEKVVPDFDGSLTGQVLGKIVLSILQKLKLDPLYLASISTDTCSVMASTEKGAVAEIKSISL